MFRALGPGQLRFWRSGFRGRPPNLFRRPASSARSGLVSKPSMPEWTHVDRQKSYISREILKAAELALTDPVKVFRDMPHVAQDTSTLAVGLRLPPRSRALQSILDKAISERLWSLASSMFLKYSHLVVFSSKSLATMLSGLTLYDPVYLPLHMKSLEALMAHLGPRAALAAPEKTKLIDSALEYSTGRSPALDLVGPAFHIATQTWHTSGEVPLPISSILLVTEHARKRMDDTLMVKAWHYVSYFYGPSLPSYTPLLLKFLEYFRRHKRLAPLTRRALDVAKPKLDPESNPGLCVAAIKACVAIQDWSRGAKLHQRFIRQADQILQRPLLGAILLFYTAAGDQSKMQQMVDLIQSTNRPNLTAHELGNIIKILARRDMESAEEFLNSNQRDLKYRLPAHIQLCSQSANLGDIERFGKYISALEETPEHSNGVVLNLKVKWEYYNGDFACAKKHYQTAAAHVPIARDQRVVVLAQLADFVSLTLEKQKRLEIREWLEAECARLGVPFEPIRQRLNCKVPINPANNPKPRKWNRGFRAPETLEQRRQRFKRQRIDEHKRRQGKK